MYIFCSIFLLLLPYVKCVDYEMDEVSNDRYKQGEEQFSQLKHFSSLPNYGECWYNAVKQLQAGCKHLDAEMQSRLAIKLVSCFRESHGLGTVECSDDDEISKCRESMDETAYSTFVTYFTHTQNMCYYLQSQLWNKETVKTIAHLSSTSKIVADKLEESQVLQEQLKLKQDETLENQERLLLSGNQLSTFMEASTEHIHQVFNELASNTQEHKLALVEIFSKVEKLQALVLGEFNSFYSILYYCLAIITAYLVTSAPRTAAARFWIFIILTANIVLERAVVNVSIKESQHTADPSMPDVNDVIYHRVNLCRRLSAFTSALILIFVAWTYKDLMKVNNELLLKVQQQNQQIVALLQGGPGLPNGHVPSLKYPSIHGDVVTAPILPIDIVDNCSNLPEDESEMSDDSSDSHLTDYSYHPVVDRQVFTTTTPIRHSAREPSSTEPRRPPVNQIGAGFSPSLLSAFGLGASTPRSRSNSRTPVVQRTYNLRNRTVSPGQPNPVLETETEHEFSMRVRQTLADSRRNASHLRQMLNR